MAFDVNLNAKWRSCRDALGLRINSIQQRHRCKWSILHQHLATLIRQEHALVRKAVLATFKRARKIESPKKADQGRPWNTLERGTSTLLQPLFFIPRNTRSQWTLGVTVTWNGLICDDFRWNGLCQRRWVSLLTHPVKASQSALLGVSGP